MNFAYPQYNSFFPVVPSDLQTLSQTNYQYAWGLWIGNGGNVVVKGADGKVATFLNVPNGSLIPVLVFQVMNTGTTASGILALYNAPRASAPPTPAVAIS